jgi:hypothetical protein
MTKADKLSDAIYRLEEIRAQIKELVHEALQLVEHNDSERAAERAKAYWYGHIMAALDDDSMFVGRSMHSMADSEQELRNALDDAAEAEDEQVGGAK